MTDKEKQAIERCKTFKPDIYIEHPEMFGSRWKVEQDIKSIEAIKVVLNLIEKQQSEIERYKYLYQKALDNTIKSDRDNLKKDKIIDLMAEQLRTPVNSKEWVIEYYTNKVEENRKE